MNKQNLIQPVQTLAVFMLLLASAFALQSCLDEENEYAQLTIGTVRDMGGHNFYFEIDNGTTMYPGDTTHISGYQIVDGQRAFIHFNLLDEPLPGYDYNAIIYRIENILTKDIYFMPPEKEDSIGHDPINITNLWFTDNYLNIQYQLYYNNASSVKHMLNLVVNEATAEETQDADYLTLELRHNAFNEPRFDLGAGLVSFKLDSIAEIAAGKRGLNIRVNSLYSGIQQQTIDFKQ